MHQIACRVSSLNFHKFSGKIEAHRAPPQTLPHSASSFKSWALHAIGLGIVLKFLPSCAETRLWHMLFQNCWMMKPHTPVRLTGSEDDGKKKWALGPQFYLPRASKYLYRALGKVELQGYKTAKSATHHIYEIRRSGNRQSGIRRSGIRPSGIRPSGNRQSGIRQSGIRPSGIRRSGIRPSGNRQSGIRPSGRKPYRQSCYDLFLIF